MSGFNDLIAASAESLLNEDLRVRQGASWNIGYALFDAAGAVVDLTGATATMDIKDNKGIVLATFTHTLTSGRQIVLGNGTAAITASSTGSNFSLTANFDGYYNLMVTKSGSTLSLVSGSIRIFI